LVHGFELGLDFGIALAAISSGLLALATLALLGTRLGSLVFATATAILFLGLDQLKLLLVARVQLVQWLSFSDLVVLELAATHLSTPTSVSFGLPDPWKAGVALGFPLIEPSTSISRRQFGAALCADDLDVVSAGSVSLDELFLFLVPGERVIAFSETITVVSL
jgi:glutamate/tyrosine decarboxylase-like PLP-dependent enzyme